MKTLAAITAVVVVLVVAVIPSAGSAGVAHADAPGVTPPREAPRPRDHKRVSTAFLITWAATAGPALVGGLGSECGSEACAGSLGMIGVAGLVLGPSAGHWYAGEGVTTGLVLRGSAAVAVTFLALRDPYLDQPVLTIGGLFAALGVWETGVIWDLVTLPRAVRRHNKRVDLLVTPLVTDRTAGLALSGAW